MLVGVGVLMRDWLGEPEGVALGEKSNAGGMHLLLPFASPFLMALADRRGGDWWIGVRTVPGMRALKSEYEA